MDYLNKLAGGNRPTEGQQTEGGQIPTNSEGVPQQVGGSTGGGGSFFDKLSSQANQMAGGGAAGEAKEDYLDKGIDMFQERVLGQGQQSNETALEQAKDEQMSDFIRAQYKQRTGKDFPIADK